MAGGDADFTCRLLDLKKVPTEKSCID